MTETPKESIRTVDANIDGKEKKACKMLDKDEREELSFMVWKEKTVAEMKALMKVLEKVHGKDFMVGMMSKKDLAYVIGILEKKKTWSDIDVIPTTEGTSIILKKKDRPNIASFYVNIITALREKVNECSKIL